MPTYKLGHGSSVTIIQDPDGTPVSTKLAGVMDVSLPNIEIDEVDVTNQDSGGQRQYISGLRDNGEVEFEMRWLPGSATDTLLTALKNSGDTVHVQFDIIPDGSSTFLLTEVYEGFLKGYERTAPVDDVAMATATFRISAQVS